MLMQKKALIYLTPILFIILFSEIACAKKTSVNQNGSDIDTTNMAILNEKWYYNQDEAPYFFGERDSANNTDVLAKVKDLDKLDSTTIAKENWYNRGHAGIDYSFFKDGTFKITSWRYFVSAGHSESSLSGQYQYNESEQKITLILDEKSVQTMTDHVYEDGYERPFFPFDKENTPILSVFYLQIINKSADKIEVDIYGLKENGEVVHSPKGLYLRKEINEE